MSEERASNAAEGAYVARRYIVSGQVQGVGFRYYTCEWAWKYALTGRVRNLPDRTVEVLARGTREQLERFESWLRHGPPQARVDVLRVEAIGELGYTDFDIDS